MGFWGIPLVIDLSSMWLKNTLFILMTTHLKEVMKMEDDKIYTQYVLHK
jgi:hypothetical protein